MIFQPGRVATLVQDSDHLVWGVAYKVPQEIVDDVKNRLAYREKDYDTHSLTFHPRENNRKSFQIMLYIGSPNHPNFGPADEKEIAHVIKRSTGPSGRNTEYLFKLAEFVRKHIPEDNDKHLFDLERLVKCANSSA